MADKGGNPAVVVIDCGSERYKAGLAGDNAPSVLFPTVTQVVPSKLSYTKSEFLIGKKVYRSMGDVTVRHPVEHGVIRNWDDMEKIWHHTYYKELKLPPEEHPVLLTEAPFTDFYFHKSSREKMTQIMFETFASPAIFIANQAVLSLYATGHLTGIVLESGHGVSHTVPVYEGYALSYATQRLPLAGCDLNEYLKTLCLTDGRYQYLAGSDGVQGLKEELCYVAMDSEIEMQMAVTPELRKSFVLSNGHSIDIDKERFKCPEALFKPSVLPGKGLEDDDAIHTVTHNSIMKCDTDLHVEMYANIVLSGGNTMFPGITDRFKKEITALAPSTMEVKVTARPERKYGAWIGGSILASMPSFQQMVVLKKEYDEHGPAFVHRKCF